MTPQRLTAGRRRQHGLATLVVVMVLFFIVSLVAAYTSRNMIFEQKTSVNQYRSTQAMAAAEAGVDWALAMLNGGRIDDDCNFDATKVRSFRERYLDFEIDAVTGRETGMLLANPGHTGNWPTCVVEGSEVPPTITCKCPFAANLDPAAVGAGPQSAFRVRLLENNPTRPGAVSVQVRGCTRLDVANGGCLDWSGQPATGDGAAVVTVLAALRSGLATPPAAAVTARGIITVAGPALNVVNRDTATAGITVHTGAGLNPAFVEPITLPGTPGEFSLVPDDPALQAFATGDRMFAAFFGMRRAVYRQQPAVLVCADPCNAAAVTALMDGAAASTAYPNHVIRVDGDLTVDGNLGSAAVPMLLMVAGDVRITADAAITGLVYLAKADAEIDRGTFTTTLSGALVAEQDLDVVGTGDLTLSYDATVLNRLRTTYGSFVRVPGSWKDWN